MSRDKTTETARQGTTSGGTGIGDGSVQHAKPGLSKTGTSNNPQRGTAPASPRPAVHRSLAVAGAVATAVVLWLVGFGLLGLTPEVGAAGQVQEVTLASTVAVPLLAGLAAWGLLALLERRGAKGLRVWRISGRVFLAVSLLGPLGLGADGGTLALLLLMHVSVVAVLLLGLPVPRRDAPAYSVKNRDGKLS